ncbi:unnamed protein product [Mytilus coruscus]|uniref:CCHC-type domain-containing protein n=1 Tax=Mytilus coruscus TaxID=42192 RepID=A0A6J8BTZ1_MYTCO|nr:unnamed protein product [Mytilus coruscus]
MNFQHCNNFDENISSIDCNNDCLNDSITAEEVLKVVKDLKLKKSAGCDGITNEMIRVSCGKLVKTYVLIFNLIFKSGIFPSIWRENIIKPIFKGGCFNDPSNYRGIALSSCLDRNRDYGTFLVKDQYVVNVECYIEECFANFKTCFKCGKKGHYTRMCYTRVPSVKAKEHQTTIKNNKRKVKKDEDYNEIVLKQPKNIELQLDNNELQKKAKLYNKSIKIRKQELEKHNKNTDQLGMMIKQYQQQLQQQKMWNQPQNVFNQRQSFNISNNSRHNRGRFY